MHEAMEESVARLAEIGMGPLATCRQLSSVINWISAEDKLIYRQGLAALREMILTSCVVMIVRIRPEPFETQDISSRFFCHDEIQETNGVPSSGAVRSHSCGGARCGGISGNFRHFALYWIFFRIPGHAHVARKCSGDANPGQKDGDDPALLLGPTVELSCNVSRNV